MPTPNLQHIIGNIILEVGLDVASKGLTVVRDLATQKSGIEVFGLWGLSVVDFESGETEGGKILTG